VYLFVDNSKDNAIGKASVKEKYGIFIDGLWENYNIKFLVV